MTPDEKLMAGIVESLLDVIKLTGGRCAPADFSAKHRILPMLWEVGRSARLVSDEARQANNEHTDWNQLDRLHPDCLTDSEFTQSRLEGMLAAGLASEKSLIEISEGAGLLTMQTELVISERTLEYQERKDGRNSMVSRSNWWLGILVFLSISVWSVSSAYPNIISTWELGALMFFLFPPFLIFGKISLSPRGDKTFTTDRTLSPERHRKRLAFILSGQKNSITKKLEYMKSDAKDTSWQFKTGCWSVAVWAGVLLGCVLPPY